MNNHLNDNIISTIDYKFDENGNYSFFMKDVTDFEWDEMVIYHYINNDSTGFVSGMVFKFKNKTVLEDEVESSISDRPRNKLSYNFKPKPNEPDYRVLTPEDAFFEGNRIEYKGKFYYEIKPKDIIESND
ncbi:MAG: hypothetical protein PHV32_01820 [Eubacteriales bacterium]|nr:hypothetical protein [Eubacteriales bacterium]